MGGGGGGVVDALGGFLEVGGGGFHYVDEFLGVAVGPGEPGAVDLDHDAVTVAEGVIDVGQIEIESGGLVGDEGGSGFSNELRNLPRKGSPRTSCW